MKRCRVVSGFTCYNGIIPKMEVMPTAKKKDAAAALRQRSLEAALLAVERLSGLLSDPDCSNGDALKAAAMIFEKIIPLSVGGGGGAGDYEILVKEDASCPG